MKGLILSLAALLTISMSACSQNKKENNTMEKKTLVVYFSATGTTAQAAKLLAQAADADIYEIVPEKTYTNEDLDWTNKKSRSTLEMNDKSSRPAIKGVVKDLAQYDTIYLGFPIWWYTAPTIINTFIEKNDLKDKTIITFATSGGSSVDKATRDLKASYPTLNIRKGRLLNDATLRDAKRLVEESK
jgi:flavodoxin